jgi:hypothetical protein
MWIHTTQGINIVHSGGKHERRKNNTEECREERLLRENSVYIETRSITEKNKESHI